MCWYYFKDPDKIIHSPCCPLDLEIKKKKTTQKQLLAALSLIRMKTDSDV